jgi:disulfide bond formation protein DsbB
MWTVARTPDSGSNQPAGAGSAVRSPGDRLTRRPINCAGFLICGGLIAYALHAQFDLGLDPCPLCIFQRIGIAALGVVFLIAALHHPRRWSARIYALLIAACLGCTGFIASARGA